MIAPAATLPGHLLPLAGDEWAVWRCIGLRSAGFPACAALRLAAPDAAVAADAVLAAEDRREALWSAEEERIEAALDRLRERGEWHDLGQRRPLLDRRLAVRKRRLGRRFVTLVGEQAAADLAAAEAAVEAAEAMFGEAFTEALARQSQVLHEVAGWKRFQEAVIWQNRGAFHTAVRPVAVRPPGAVRGNSRRRRSEGLVASYLQRYAVKNDTIGYFGPVGWARFSEWGEGLRMRPGEDLLAARETYLEAWGVDKLAASLSRHLAIRRWLKPRWTPFVRATPDEARLPGPASLSALERKVLAACDGRRTARSLARKWLAGPAAFASEESFYALLDRFQAAGWIDWGFALPVSPYALGALREQVEEVGDAELRRACLKAVEALEQGRKGVAAAAGDAGRLDRALGRLNETFRRLTGAAPERHAGSAYVGRTLVYEDCRRDLELALGPGILARLAPPLELVLTSARWFTWELAARARRYFESVYLELVADQGSRVVDAMAFWQRVRGLVSGDDRSLSREVLGELQRRWQQVLGVAPEKRRLARSYDAVAAAARTAFAAPATGWEHARYHNPDLLIDAPGAEAVAAGEGSFVLGELHAAMNTLNFWVFVGQHPSADEIRSNLEADLMRGAVAVLPSKDTPTRMHPAYVSSRDHLVMPMANLAAPGSSPVLPLADLVLEQIDDGLVLRSREGSPCFDVVEAFGDILAGLERFQLLGDSPHWPRVSIDRLVVWRESWRFAAEDLGFAHRGSEQERFLGVRRWARRHGLPRHVFAKVPGEEKPFYVDFDSPVSTELLGWGARLAQRSATPGEVITITEMLPDHDGLWLEDERGERYTCELRVLATDRKQMPGDSNDNAS